MNEIKLSTVVGEQVTIENEAYTSETGRFNFSLHGTLENVDECGLFHVRIKECGQGTSGMSFHPREMRHVERMDSGRIVITLK